MSTRTIIDPFLNLRVEISSKLTDRLRGRYANGPTMPNGEPEFGWREFPVPPIQREAADEIERLQALLGRWVNIAQNGTYGERTKYPLRKHAIVAETRTTLHP